MAFDIEKTFRTIANGNQSAFEFMLRFYAWVHAVDDLVDRDKVVNLDNAGTHLLLFVFTLSENEFYSKHSQEINPILLTSFVAYLESERFRLKDGVLDRIASQVLKSQYQDVFYYVAFLVGGISHAVAMSKLLREYDYDPTPPPK